MSTMTENPFQANPPLGDRAAAFTVDMLAMAAGLMHGPEMYFYDSRLVGTAVATPAPVCGTRQVHEYLLSFVFTDDLVQLMQASAIVKKLNLDLTRLRMLVGERPWYDFEIEPEGSMAPAGKPFAKLLGNTFCTSLVHPTVDRLWRFQSGWAMTALREIAEQKKYAGDHFQGLVDVSGVRRCTATEAAYASRARNLAGMRRWIDDHLSGFTGSKDADPPANVATPHTRSAFPESGWRVRATEFLQREDRVALLGNTGLYGRVQAERLLKGGLVAIRESECTGDDLFSRLFDAAPRQPRMYYNEKMYMYLDPYTYAQPKSCKEVLLTDRYYGTLLGIDSTDTAPKYGVEGLYSQLPGGKSVLDVLSSVKAVGETRAFRYRIPLVQADTRAGFDAIVEHVRSRLPAKHLLYRGQVHHYTLNRPADVNRFLYGQDTVDELSLTNASWRAGFEWDHFAPRFKLMLQDLMYSAMPASAFAKTTVDEEGSIRFVDPHLSGMHKLWRDDLEVFDQIATGLAQHYGIPTDGLDLSSDANVALWMATHRAYRCGAPEENVWSYQHVESGKDRPIVYLVHADLNPDNATTSMGIAALQSVRQQRQAAHLHYGGWGFHSNLCATETILGVFLGDECIQDCLKSGWKTDYLFPPEQEDLLFGRLLELKDRCVAAGMGWGFDRLCRCIPG